MHRSEATNVVSSSGLLPRFKATAHAFVVFAVVTLAACAASTPRVSTPLPSWNPGSPRQAIEQFVDDVTRQGSADFVPPAERIAVFDNDGTLWSEQPLYFQLLFMLDQVKAAAPQHPEWQDDPVYRALAANDLDALARLGEKPLLDLLTLANSGMTTDVYEQAIRQWLATARHPSNSSTTVPANPSASTGGSGAGPCSRSAIRTATCRCCSTRWRAPVGDWR